MKTLKRLLSLLLFLGLLWAFWFLATHDFSRPVSKPPPASAPDPWADMLTTALHVFVIGVMALLLAAGVAALYALLLHTRHRAQMATPDGRAPLSHPLAARWYDVREAEARRLTLPTTLTWSPSTSVTHEATANGAATQSSAAALPVLSAEEALAQPGIVYGQRLDDGELLVDQGVRSLAIGGRPGSGKTSTAALLAAQHVRLGAELRLVDPHGGHPESLVARCEPLLGRLPAAETPREALILVQQVHDQLQQRKDAWSSRAGPVALFLDEFPELVRLLPPDDRQRMLDLVSTIGYSGRKYGIAVVLLAQSWLVAAVGSSQVRNPVPAAIVHAMRADEARAMTGIPAGGWPMDPQLLEVGQAYVCGVASGVVAVRVPALGSPYPGSYPVAHSASSLLPPPTLAILQGREQGREQGRDAEILRLFQAGHGYPEIISILYGEKVAGTRFKEARQEVEGVIRRALQEE